MICPICQHPYADCSCGFIPKPKPHAGIVLVSPQSPIPPPTTSHQSLTSFARSVLKILELEKQWDADTLDLIAEAAYATDLARIDPSGHFKSTL